MTLDGGEEPGGPPLPRRRTQPLTPAQVDVMRQIRKVGHIRPVEAGLILYAHTEESPEAAEARSRYASSDGSEMLRRMAKRGLVHRAAPGRWVAGPPVAPLRLRRSEMQRLSANVRAATASFSSFAAAMAVLENSMRRFPPEDHAAD